MGHARLGTLPDTRPWRQVVDHLAGGEGAAAVANAVSEAAIAGLDRARIDRGFAHVLYLLARTVLSARELDFAGSLAGIGIICPGEPTLFDLTSGFAAGMRDWYAGSGVPRTDVAEMAEAAGLEALTRCLGNQAASLSPIGGEVRTAARELSTATGFATLTHEVFNRFGQRFLHYHLDRELSHHIGGNGRFPDRESRKAFASDLAIHCSEAAVVVRRYAGEWYSKARFEDGISERQAARFATTCASKLKAELTRRGSRHG